MEFSPKTKDRSTPLGGYSGRWTVGQKARPNLPRERRRQCKPLATAAQKLQDPQLDPKGLLMEKMRAASECDTVNASEAFQSRSQYLD